jgi:hypothetical protein
MSVKNAMDAISTTIQQMIENDRQKIGGLTLGASARLGLEEVRQAVALDGSVSDQTQTPLGMYGTLTPGEVGAARADDVSAAKQNAASNDPVADAQRQARASKETSHGHDDHDASR